MQAQCTPAALSCSQAAAHGSGSQSLQLLTAQHQHSLQKLLAFSLQQMPLQDTVWAVVTGFLAWSSALMVSYWQQLGCLSR